MGRIELSQQTRVIVFGTVNHFISGFLIERQSRGLAAGTIKYYKEELARFALWMDAAGVLQLDEITPDLIRRFLLSLKETRNTGGVHAVYRAVRAFFHWYEAEFEPVNWKNPLDKVKVPVPSKDPLPGLELVNFDKLIDAVSGNMATRDRIALLFLLDTGVRAAEFCALNVGDVDLMTGGVVVHHGKGDKRRIVFVGQTVLHELRKYIRERGTPGFEDPLFINDEGQRLKFGGLRAAIKRLSKRAGIAAPGLHDFRRAFAVQMLRNGVDVMTLARLMGHTTLEVTRRYLHLVEDDLKAGHIKGSPVDHLVIKHVRRVFKK